MSSFVFDLGNNIIADYLEMAAPRTWKSNKPCYRVHVVDEKNFEGMTYVVNHTPNVRNAKRLMKKTFKYL